MRGCCDAATPRCRSATFDGIRTKTIRRRAHCYCGNRCVLVDIRVRHGACRMLPVGNGENTMNNSTLLVGRYVAASLICMFTLVGVLSSTAHAHTSGRE